MPRIFISYRRSDSRKDAGRIYDRLRQEFGADNVFKDVDDIPFGSDFRKVLATAVNACDIVLVLIGADWLNALDDEGQRRLDDPADFVRIEVETGLRRDCVIPVLIDNARMPKEKDLPASLVDLIYRNAAQVRDDPDFHHDMNRLIENMKHFEVGVQADAPAPVADLEISAKRVRVVIGDPFEWCEVSAGSVTIEDDSEYSGSKGGVFQVERFWMAKYPITNKQFQAFIDDPQGYAKAQWWEYSAEARAWHQENPQPEELQYKGDDLPRTNVSWFESIAFCFWLNDKLDLSPSQWGGAKGEGYIMLPTEEQWQRAALGDTGWLYPWGNEIDPDHANYESNVDQPTTVTEYPKGKSTFEVFGMSGNVWEWCLNEYTTNNPYYNKDRGLRGGTWLDNDDAARAAYRFHHFPFERLSSNIGFRVVCLFSK